MVSNLIVCGGTFDHFHQGHKSLLRLAFSLGEKILIGITSDEYCQNLKFKNQNSKFIESFDERKKTVLEFVKNEKVLKKAEIIKIEDLFGMTLLKNLLIDAIVVSRETSKGAEIINQKRKELGLSLLNVIIAPFVRAQDGQIISSERIRKGEISREGKLYIKKLWLKKDLMLPEDLKSDLKKPFGEIVVDIKKNDDFYIVTVGDATTKKFNESRIGQNISVVDFKIARKEVFFSFSDLGFSENETIITVNNPAGHIMHDVFLEIIKIFKFPFKEKVILKIIGEDDLIVLPLILGSPLGTVIYYGQPGVGLIKIDVSEKNKEQAYNLATKFRPI
jgi:pantetheine-phosphate adenylyltransferase